MHWPSPAQRTRIAEIRDNLIARIAEAEQEGWHGEAEGLKISLAGARDKLAQIDRRSAPARPVTRGAGECCVCPEGSAVIVFRWPGGIISAVECRYRESPVPGLTCRGLCGDSDAGRDYSPGSRASRGRAAEAVRLCHAPARSSRLAGHSRRLHLGRPSYFQPAWYTSCSKRASTLSVSAHGIRRSRACRPRDHRK